MYFCKTALRKSNSSISFLTWNNHGIIDLLVQRSSGQFIYATTVLKFLGADFYSPGI